MPIVLRAPSVVFYSQADEAALFHALESIPSVARWWYESDTLCLRIRSDGASCPGVHDLVGVFFRYRIDMTQLAQLRCPRNERSFQKLRKTFFWRYIDGSAALFRLHDLGATGDGTDPHRPT